MRSLTLAVLSDLHVGRTRAKDLSPTDPSRAVDPDYKAKFIKFIRDRRLTADYLLVPGDVSDRAQPQEFQLASTLVLEVARALGLEQSRVIFVPGNHDVDWSATTGHLPDSTGFRRTQRYAPLRHSEWIFEEIMRRSSGYLLEPPDIAVWETDDLFAVGYNSSWHDDPDTTTHHGLFASEAAAQIRTMFAVTPPPKNKLRLLLVHHHPIQYSDPIADEPDFSVLTNADELHAILREFEFDLLVHGHKHKPNFRTSIIDSGSPVAIFGAGSFSAILDTRWSGVVANQFHRITISGRDIEHGSVYGRVESWAYVSARGWLPSEKGVHGIRHIEPFGTYMQPRSLESAIGALLAPMLARRDYVEWESVVRKDDRLRYLPPDLVTTSLDRIGTQLGFRRHGSSPEEIVLLKMVEFDA